MTNFRVDEIIILLGAGASREAGILTSSEMINELEDYVSGSKPSWKPYKDLYNYIRSSIFFADGIAGKFGDSVVNYNIERVVNSLKELNKRDQHTIFPFIGNWNTKLSELAGPRFKHVRSLERQIINQLKSWVVPEDYSKANYLQGLVRFGQKEYGYPLRVFSLNYDLCLEKSCSTLIRLERGFDENRKWNHQRFERDSDEGIGMFLYKMHGSIDWKRDFDDELTFVDDTTRVDEPQLIFGTDYKLQYIDPYLFYAYEFRRLTLLSQVIIAIGYGFGDDHINAIIGQALKQSSNRTLICVGPSKKEVTHQLKFIQDALGLKASNQIQIINKLAAEYLNRN